MQDTAKETLYIENLRKREREREREREKRRKKWKMSIRHNIPFCAYKRVLHVKYAYQAALEG